VVIVKGNYDYVDPELPFFLFLKHIPGIKFISSPEVYEFDVGEALCLPHDRNPETAWKNLEINTDMVFCHQTFDGAMAGQDYALKSSLSPTYFSNRDYDGIVISGDIHKPQEIGDITYVGTPYPVSFGETHKPRVFSILPHGEEILIKDLNPPSIRKLTVTIRDVSELPKLRSGDQIKVKVQLAREEFADWEQHRKDVVAACEASGVAIRSLELADTVDRKTVPTEGRPTAILHEDLLEEFCASRQLSDGEHQVAQDILDELQV